MCCEFDRVGRVRAKGRDVSGPDIFISYSREDSAVAHTYRETFQRAGFEVWWDQALQSGETYDEVTENALRSAKAVVVLWSPRSVASRWVRAEATVADRNKTFVPVMIEACDRPVMFELTQTADLTCWGGDDDDMGWVALVEGLRRKIGHQAGQAPESRSAVLPAGPAASGRTGPPLVGVLPISHRDSDEDLAFLAEDLTEDIMRELSQDGFLRVVAAGRMEGWRDRKADYQAIGRDLGTCYLIEGKLQRSGGNARLSMQLVDCATGGICWSKRFTESLDEVHEAPERLAVKASMETGEMISQAEMKAAMAKTGALSGWEHLLRGRYYEFHPSIDSLLKTGEEARKAVAAAPDLGIAHAFLAQHLAARVASGGEVLDEARLRELQTHARLAMQLDGENPAVIIFLTTHYSLQDPQEYLRQALRLRKLRPNWPSTWFYLASGNFGVGRTAEAIAAAREYLKSAEVGIHLVVALWIKGACEFLEGQIEEAEVSLNQSLDCHPEFHLALKFKAIVLATKGDEAGALATVRRLRRTDPEMSIEQHVQQIVFNPYHAGPMADGVEVLRRLWDAAGAIV